MGKRNRKKLEPPDPYAGLPDGLVELILELHPLNDMPIEWMPFEVPVPKYRTPGLLHLLWEPHCRFSYMAGALSSYGDVPFDYQHQAGVEHTLALEQALQLRISPEAADIVWPLAIAASCSSVTRGDLDVRWRLYDLYAEVMGYLDEVFKVDYSDPRWHHASTPLPGCGEIIHPIERAGFDIRNFRDLVFIAKLVKADLIASGKFIMVVAV